MKNCPHKLAIKINGTIKGPSIGIEVLGTVHAKCLLCFQPLTDEEIKSALTSVYSSEVSEIVFGLYFHRRSYFELLTKLNTFSALK